MANQQTITTDATAPESSTAQTLWRIAVAEYERTKAAHEQAVAAYNEAEGKVFAERRGEVDYATTYGFRGGQDDADRIRAAEVAIVIRDYRGQSLTPAMREAVEAEATRAVEGFAAQQQAHADAQERHNLAELDKTVEQTANAFIEAEAALFKTPAPDADAMLAKLDTLIAKMVECDENDTANVSAIRDDARRLFARAA